MELLRDVFPAMACVLVMAGGAYLLLGLLVRPGRTDARGVWTVVYASGEGEDLEQRLRALMWLRGLGLQSGRILLVDGGLSARGREVADCLTRRWPVVFLAREG